MRHLVFTFVFTCIFLTSFGQEESRPKAKLLTSFRFTQYSGGEIMFQATFDTVQTPLNFLLDTGSGGISLDSSTCAEFGIKSRLTDTTVSGIGGAKKVHFVFNKTLHLPGLAIDSLNFHINDYTQLSGIYGQKIDGIVGYAFLSRYLVRIDNDSMNLEVYSFGTKPYPRRGTLLHPVFTALPIQYLTINDRRKLGYRFYFDTGAGLGMLLSKNFAEDSSIIKKSRRPVVTSVDGMLGSAEMKLTVIKSLSLGPYTFRNVPTYIYDDANNVTNYPFTGGLIGSEIFRRFNVTLNYAEKEIHLEPNSHFYDPFDYSYVGMTIYLLDDKIIAREIIPGSPAARAGFRNDDEILSVDKDFSFSVQSYRRTMQVANKSMRVIIKRNGDLVNIELRTGSIR